MKVQIQGSEVHNIRKLLGLSCEQLANVLAVHPGTVSRWERAGDGLVSVDGVAASVLAVLRERVRTKPVADELRSTGERVAQALLVGGALLGLIALLKALVDDRS